uniref:Uncharacterized protein n=1 Tax=Echeneis naucrates TaxID=173247 RepID=A0A665X5N6_ECHNA
MKDKQTQATYLCLFILLLCTNCHATSNGCEEGVCLLEDWRTMAGVLGRSCPAHSWGRPARTVAERTARFDQKLMDEALLQVATLEIRIFNEAYIPHGLKVARAHHFLISMQPCHLPLLWCVDHNPSKFLRKYGEDLPIKLN